jgi:hypothetical protein
MNLLRRFLNWLKRLLGITQPPRPPSTPQPRSPAVVTAPEMGLAANEPPIYRKSDSLFTYRERIFYGVLQDAVNRDYWIFAKVRLADFMWLTNEPEDRKFHANRILCKHVDFLLCERRTYRPLMAIELDDRSHLKYDHRERDEFKDKTFAAIGLPLLRVPLERDYSREELRAEIQTALMDKKPAEGEATI